MNEKNLHLSFLYTLGFTQRKLSFILDEWIDPTEVYCSPSSFFERLKITEEKWAKILLAKQIFDEKKHQEILKKNEVTLISKTEDTYPSLLGQLPNSPAILYVQWKLPHHDKLISVVGSRKHSPYAKQALEITLPGVLERWYEVVSGGAYGLDSVAHEMCVNRWKPTHIVLGSGIDLWYPRWWVKLFQQALDAWGSIISHFPLETLAEPYNFPIRNEVVAGISRGTLVAEAAEESWTLITARLALEMNRDVFVIPADISREGAWGSNQLIRDGLGKLTTSADDIQLM